MFQNEWKIVYVLILDYNRNDHKPSSALITLIFFFPVSAQILKASLDTMERHIQRLENDIQNFPKTDEKQDKFVEKMSISFEYISYCFGTGFQVLS